jgi:hypothetical protein
MVKQSRVPVDFEVESMAAALPNFDRHPGVATTRPPIAK